MILIIGNTCVLSYCYPLENKGMEKMRSIIIIEVSISEQYQDEL